MTKSILFSLAIATAVVGTSPAFADGIIRPALSYAIDKEQGDTSSTTTRQMIDLAGGYLTAGGWAILGMYSMENSKTEAGNSTSHLDRTSYGVGGGWYSKEAMGPYIDGIYYLNSELKDGSSKYEGTGWQVDLGYKFNISGNIGFGAQLAYRSFAYTKYNGAKVDYKKTNLDPMFAFIFVF